MRPRLATHDYRGKGFYFITFSTEPRSRLLSTIENSRIFLTPEGEAVLEAWRRIPEDDPAYSLRYCVIMPDHFHGILVCEGGATMALGRLVARLKGRSLQAIRRLRHDPNFRLWEAGFYDLVAFSATTFNRFSTYVRENPVRWQLRHDNPRWFRGHSGVVHPRLPADAQWTAYGDQTLLDYPWLLPVILSRRLEGEALQAAVVEVVEQVRQGAVPIGGFISPAERLVAEAVTQLPRARMIRMHPWGLANYKPSGRVATEWLATGRTLVLSGFPPEVERVPTREHCLRNNAWARAIAAGVPRPR